MEELMRTESVLEGNLCNIFDVLISLCDSDAKNKVESMTSRRTDSIGLLVLIKRLIYTGSTNGLHTRHNKIMCI